VTQINHAIGGEGVVSMECKEIVSEYGDMIWDLLVAGVCSFFLLAIYILHLLHSTGFKKVI
jgi:phytepsin